MAEFLEERLPIDVRMGASTGDDYAVDVKVTAGGAEYRRLIHPYPMRRWTINFTLLRSDLATRVLALYHRAYGRYAGFRVRSWDDFTTAQNGRDAPTNADQSLLRLSAGVYQLRKAYGQGASGIGIGLPVRTIYKPVAGTLLIAKNGVAVVSGVTLNSTNGQVTISPAPLVGDAITGGFEFDLPARFDSSIDVTAIARDARDCGSIDIIELLAP